MRRRALAVLVFISLLPLAAKADSVFHFAGASVTDGSNNYNVTGTITIDDDDEMVSGDVTVGSNDFTLDPTQMGAFYDGVNDGYHIRAANFDVANSDGSMELFLAFNFNDAFSNFTGGPICTLGVPCVEYDGSNVSNTFNAYIIDFTNPVRYDFTNGSLDSGNSPAATPEPSSLMLLGTGLLGTVGAVRRRLHRA